MLWLSNSLNWFFKEMYGDQSWESVCGYSKLSCHGNYIWICAYRPTSNSTFRQVTERTYPETSTWSSTSRYFSKIYKRTNPRIEKIQIVLTNLCWQQRIIYTLWRTTYFYRQRLGIKKQTALLCEDCHLTQIICSKRTVGLVILKQRAFVGNAVLLQAVIANWMQNSNGF